MLRITYSSYSKHFVVKAFVRERVNHKVFIRGVGGFFFCENVKYRGYKAITCFPYFSMYV